MPRNAEQKIKLLILYEILKTDTDENSPMSTSCLIEKLKERGVDVGRKALKSDIDTLNQYGFEVLWHKDKSNQYYVVDRKFQIPELKILIDAVQSASFITEKKTISFVDKIADLAGKSRAELLKQNIVCFDTTKHTNENIYYNIDTLDSCILDKKKVSFVYFDYDTKCKKCYRKEKERYIVNPLALIFTNDNYYLVCYNDKYKNLSNYRVDRMEQVKCEKEEITYIEELSDFNINTYKQQAFSMYAGEPTEIVLEISNRLMDAIIDKFGEKVKPIVVDENKVKVLVQVIISPTFYSWLVAFNVDIRILSPQEEVEKFKNYILDTIEKF